MAETTDTNAPAPQAPEAAPAQDTPTTATPPAPSTAGPSADQAAAPQPNEVKAAEVPAAPTPPPGEVQDAAYRAPAFLRQVQAWANGTDVPDNATIKGCLEDLRACLAERTQVQQQLQQLEQALREQQAQLFASQGREDALLRVCYRAQASA